jgi:hypothetical protein
MESSSQEVCLSREISKRNIVNGCLLLRAFVPASERVISSASRGCSGRLNAISYFIICPCTHPSALSCRRQKRERQDVSDERGWCCKNIHTHPELLVVDSDVWPAAVADGVISCAICVVRAERKVLFKFKARKKRLHKGVSCLTGLKIAKAELSVPGAI